MDSKLSSHSSTASTRLISSVVIGAVMTAAIAMCLSWKYAPLGGWDTAMLIYVLWTGLSVWPMNARSTAGHAKREDPGRTWTDVLLIIASVASLVAVGFLITQAGNDAGHAKAFDIALGLLSVIVSWAAVHTTYALKYARLYYGDPEGGIDFNESEPPRYSDFAYLAFTIGMTFQVSDTDLKTKDIRRTALKHALLSFVFGTVIIATTINTIASLSQ